MKRGIRVSRTNMEGFVGLKWGIGEANTSVNEGIRTMLDVIIASTVHTPKLKIAFLVVLFPLLYIRIYIADTNMINRSIIND